MANHAGVYRQLYNSEEKAMYREKFSVKTDQLSVWRYHVLKKITEDPVSFLRRILPNGRISGGGVYHDSELHFRVFFEHHRNSHGNIGRWDRSGDVYASFREIGNGSDFAQDFISLYAKVEGLRRVGGMSEEQAVEELARDYGIPCELFDNDVPGWKQVEIDDLKISNSINEVKGYFKLSQQESELRKYSNTDMINAIYYLPNEHHRDARPMYDRDGKRMGLMVVDAKGQPALKTLWKKKPNGRKGEWHYSNFAKKPYPFDKTYLAARAKKQVIYVIGDPVLAEQFEWWQEEGVASLKGALVQAWYGGKETVVDLDWEALKHHDLRVVIRETEEDLLLAQAILEQVVGRHGLKSISLYRYGAETVYTDSVLYSFDDSRAYNLADDAFLFKLTKQDIYVGLGLEERAEVLEGVPEKQDDSLVCIEGVLERETTTMLYAYDGVGKSMIALSVGCALASGENVFGSTWKVPVRRRVLYVDGENPQKVLERREKAFRNCYGLEESSPYFRMISSGKERKAFDLTDEEFRDRLRSELLTPSGRRKVDVLILDNWSALYSGDEERAWRDVKPFMVELKHAGIGILFVNHASDANPSKPDGHKKKNRFFDNYFYALKKEVAVGTSDKSMFVSVHDGKNRSGAYNTDFDLQLSFVNSQANDERAYWLVDAGIRARDVFDLRAQGKTYQEIGKALGCSKNTANDSIKNNGHPDPVEWAKSK